MINDAALVVWAADVGSVNRDRFGWCRADHTHQVSVTTGVNKDIYAFVSGIASDISVGYSVALGFECPLFIPISSQPKQLTSGRRGEGNRPWSAGAGSGALATGLPICVWVFERLKQSATMSIEVTFDWNVFLAGQAHLFIWEAFVTKKSKTDTHHGDAEVAARSFWSRRSRMVEENDVTADNPYSLVGAALLRAELSADLSLLSKPCVVVKS